MKKDPVSGAAVLYNALGERMGGELIAGSETYTPNQLRFMIRVHSGPPTTRWLGIVQHLLTVSKKASPAWSIDISKQYFVDPGGSLRYGWRVILQGQLIAGYLEEVAREVRSAEVKGSQIEEVRLNGSPTRRVGGLMGHVAVGASASRG